MLPTPGEFALTADGTHAYLSCPQGGTIEVLNLKDWKLEEPPFGSRKAWMAWFGCLRLQIDLLPGGGNSQMVGNPSFITLWKACPSSGHNAERRGYRDHLRPRAGNR